MAGQPFPEHLKGSEVGTSEGPTSGPGTQALAEAATAGVTVTVTVTKTLLVNLNLALTNASNCDSGRRANSTGMTVSLCRR